MLSSTGRWVFSFVWNCFDREDDSEILKNRSFNSLGACVTTDVLCEAYSFAHEKEYRK
jgi:hypothetical protein